MWPNERTLRVVRYDDVTNPRWRTGAILDFDLGDKFGVDQHFLHQNWYSDEKSAVRGVPVLKNQIFENPRWRTAAILNFDFGP